MKIYINGRFLTQKITGVQRYAIEMVKALDELLKEKEQPFEFTILVPQKIDIHDVTFKHISLRRIGRLTGHAWEQLELPNGTKDGYLINLCNVAPVLKRRQMVVIHDMAVFANPTNYSFAFRSWYKFILNSIKRKSDIVTVSSFSSKEIEKFLKVKRHIEVIHEGNDQITRINTDNQILIKYDLHHKKFILAVSSLNPNKNFKAIHEAMKQLNNKDLYFVIAGGTDSRIFESTDTVDGNNTIHVGYVTDEELKALYQHALCFIFPSFYEGFGLPPIEAMASGCPVIVSNTTSMPEVCGENVLYCDPHDPKTIAKQIELISTDDDLRNELKIKGKEHSKRYKWVKSAQQLMDLIKELV